MNNDSLEYPEFYHSDHSDHSNHSDHSDHSNHSDHSDHPDHSNHSDHSDHSESEPENAQVDTYELTGYQPRDDVEYTEYTDWRTQLSQPCSPGYTLYPNTPLIRFTHDCENAHSRHSICCRPKACIVCGQTNWSDHDRPVVAPCGHMFHLSHGHHCQQCSGSDSPPRKRR